MVYPEVHSLDESLAILNKYKHELTKEQYDSIKSVICGHAIEYMYLNEKDIIGLVKIAKGKTTADEEIKKLKNEWSIE
ncbi:hypothetical protein [Campylobacter fetus]|uniref:hypothetical protein n=1 Tax=Campylobacter fetus TaxID=196 RepID=UPI00138E38ED|nr:hypothetical protein [Campylobacter fetus]